MTPLLPYLAGVATPFVAALALSLLCEFTDWRDRRRYQRAWNKFHGEWITMTPAERREFANNPPLHACHYASPEEMYFAHRWRHGQTTEV